MKGLVLLLPLLGLCQALQPGLEYQYHYSGRVASGVTQINRQFAAAGIQADVSVVVFSDYTLQFQFSHVEVADMNRQLDCDLRQPLPMEYHACIGANKDLLERPFRVTVNGTQYPEYLETPEEPVWVSNIRKSVVNIFRIAPLWERTTEVTQLNYGIQEETLAGRCMSWYTAMKYPVTMAEEIDHQQEQSIEDDAQRDCDTSCGGGGAKGKKSPGTKTGGCPKGKTSKKGRPSGGGGCPEPKLEPTLWWVTRTTDFKECEDLVKFTIHGNKRTDDAITRSSQGTYLIRGEEHRRLERAVVEGSITVWTRQDHIYSDDQRYGYMNTFQNHEEYDHIDTITNQTLELRAVRLYGTHTTNGGGKGTKQAPQTSQATLLPPPLDCPHQHHNWHYDIQKPQENQFLPMEQVLTGRPIDDTIMSNIVTFVVQQLTPIITRMSRHPHDDKVLAVVFGNMVEAVRNLDYAHIETLYSQLVESSEPDEKIDIFHQVLIHTGTIESIRFMTEQMKRGHFDIYNRKEEFYTTFDHTVQHPSAIPKIMDLLIHEEENFPNVPGQAQPFSLLTNLLGLQSFSLLLHNMCLGDCRRDIYYDYACNTYGKCDLTQIFNTYIPHLVAGLTNTDKTVWQRLMYLQALSNLGTPHTINILKPYMTGVIEQNVFIRTNAIWSLNAYNMQETATGEVYKILMPILENKREQFEIRNIAFLTLSTWKPNLAWWQRMALSTWHEPSPQVASFVYSTIYSIANSNTPRHETVAKVLHLCKPSAPASLLHSTNTFLYEYLFSEEMGTHINFAWFMGVHGMFPEEVFVRLRQEVFYGYQMVHKYDVQQRGFDRLWYLLQTRMKKPIKPKDSSARDIVQGMWEELKEKLQFESPTDFPLFKMWFKLDRIISYAEQSVIGIEPRCDEGSKWKKDCNWCECINGRQICPQRPCPIVQEGQQRQDVVADTCTDGSRWKEEDRSYTCNWCECAAGIWDCEQARCGGPDYPFVFYRLISRLSRPHFFNELDTFIALPTDVGLPFTVKYSAKSSFWLMGVDQDKGKVGIVIEAGSDVYAEARTLLPWSDRPGVSAGVYAEGQVVLPLRYHVTFDMENVEFKLDIEPIKNDRVTIFSVDTSAYTAVEVNYPTNVYFVETEYKLIKHGDDYLFNHAGQVLPSEAGLWVESQMTGDQLMPNNFFHLLSEWRCFIDTLTMNRRQHKLVYDPSQSQTTNISFIFNFVSGCKERIEEGCDPLSQSTDCGQTSQSAGELDYGNYDDVDVFGSPVRQQLAEKQQQMCDNNIWSWSFGVEMELHSSQTRKYESFFTYARRTSTQSTTNIQLTVKSYPPEGSLDESHETCLDVKIIKPKFESFVKMEQLLATNFHTTLKADLRDGVSCLQEPVVLTIEGSIDVSERAKEMVRKNVADHCEYNTFFTAIDVITSPVYDQAHFTADWTDDLSDTLKNATYIVDDIFRGYAFKKISFNHMAVNDDFKVEIDATKNLDTKHWTVRTVKPDGVSVVHDLPVPMWVDMLGSPAATEITIVNDMVYGRTPVYCLIDQHSVRTFDGNIYDYEPDECYYAMTFDMSSEQMGSALVRHNGQHWEVRIVWAQEGILFDLTPNHIYLNGEPAQGRDNRFAVEHDANSHTIIFKTGSMIKVSDKVELQLEPSHRGHTGGICGNFDGDPMNDFVGPQGCVYYDPKLFTRSWASPSEGSCGSFGFKAKVKEVQEYQENICPKTIYEATGITYPDAMHDCTEWWYHERTEGAYHCRSLSPMPFCSAGCLLGTSPTEMLFEYECTYTGHSQQQTGHGVEDECYTHSYYNVMKFRRFPADCIDCTTNIPLMYRCI